MSYTEKTYLIRIQVLLSLLVAGKVSQTQIENAPPHLRLLQLLIQLLAPHQILLGGGSCPCPCLIQLLCDLQRATFI